MKHKRQTLSKQNEDGDDKDSITSESGKSGTGSKLGDKYHDDEMSKKSCQGCELPGVGTCGALGVGSASLDDQGNELGGQPTRGNNNNTPSATNNNNSNGASSVASSTSSFDKMLGEDDSRSNEDISPKGLTVKKVSVKVEGGRKNSPNSERKIGLCKSSPSLKENGVSQQGLLMALGEGITGNSAKTGRSLTPSSAPSTPLQYAQQLPRSSPTTATAIASATVTIQNVPSTFGNRGNHFPQAAQYPPVVEYRNKHQQMSHNPYQMQNHQQTHGYSSEMVYQDHSQQSTMVNQHNVMMGRRSHARGTQNYTHQQNYQQYYQNYNSKTQQPETAYHGVNSQNYPNHSYPNSAYNNHYGYNHQGMYHGTNPSETDGNAINHQHHENSYYPTETQHHMQKSDNYYENVYGVYGNQADDATFPAASSGVMTPPASVQPDPTNAETYGATQFHNFYGNNTTEQNQNHVNQSNVQTSGTGENSNSSADFNFLSNLANDFAPEYYQLS